MLKSLRSVLNMPQAYQMWWNFVGGPAWARVLVDEYIRPTPDAHILEIGCGPGTIVRFLPQSCDYLGFDLSPEYIEQARKRFPHAQFVCERVSQFSLPSQNSFDFVLALGIVHHLEDSEAKTLFQIGHDALKPGGKLVTADGVWTRPQSPTARWLLARDRGEHIRSEEGYVGIATQVFPKVKPSVRHDLLRIPYSHMIMECVR